ncbi:MAG: hypothetical protein AAFX87_23715, partial [Bacteroidota bacterium]
IELDQLLTHPIFTSEDSEISAVNSGSIVVTDPDLVSQLVGDKEIDRFLKILCDQGSTVPLPVKIFFTGWPDYIAGGIIKHSKSWEEKGGGLRVQSIDLKSINSNRTTSYSYSGGVTSYEPFGFLEPLQSSSFPISNSQAVKRYLSKEIVKTYSDVMANSREVIAPGVIYERVTIEEYVNDNKIPGKTEYEFQVFDKNMVSIEPSLEVESGSGDDGDGQTFDKTRIKKVTISDKMNQVGSLKSVNLYDEHDQIISSTTNHYLFQESEFDSNLQAYNYQGVISETFAEARVIRKKLNPVDYEYQRHGVVSERRQYPNIQIGRTSINHKTGITTTSKNLAFDFFSGSVTKTLSTDSYGNYIVNETVPAYHNYQGMGLAMDGGANMLTQESYSKAYTVDNEIDQNPVGLIAASAQTWSQDVDQLNVVKEAKQFRYYASELNEGTRRITSLTNNIEVGDRLKVSYFFKDYTLAVIGELTGNDYEVYMLNGPIPLQFTGFFDFTGADFSPFRKHRNYVYLGDDVDLESQPSGLYPYSSFSEFITWNPAQEPFSNQWQKSSEVTLYDVYSHALEASDINGNYAATKMDINQERVFATVANANYNEFAYSGAEDTPVDGYFGGGVKLEGELVEGYGHTGSYFVQSRTATPKGFSYEIENPSSKKYRVAFWSTAENSMIKYREKRIDDSFGPISNAELLPIKSIQVSDDEEDSWYLFRGNITVSENNLKEIEIWTEGFGTTLQDDFRVHPLEATMTSYVYNQWGELSHILDANNIFTEYEYDGMGRLERVWRETTEYDKDGDYDGKVLVSEHWLDYKEKLTLAINATSQGNSASIPNLGVTDVEFSRDFTYQAFSKNGCSNPPLIIRVLVDDDIELPNANGSIQLTDGTEVVVSDDTYTFENVQGAHDIHFVLASWPAAGSRDSGDCYVDRDANDDDCFTGMCVRYVTDGCGGETQIQIPCPSGFSCSNTCDNNPPQE